MPTSIEWDPQRYKWEQLAEYISERIRSGEWGPHHQMSEYGLAEEFQVARATVRGALRSLREQGLIVTIPAKGSFPVRQPPKGGDILE